MFNLCHRDINQKFLCCGNINELNHHLGPPLEVATTGLPEAQASSTTMPKGSLREGRHTQSALLNSSTSGLPALIHDRESEKSDPPYEHEVGWGCSGVTPRSVLRYSGVTRNQIGIRSYIWNSVSRTYWRDMLGHTGVICPRYWPMS